MLKANSIVTKIQRKALKSFSRLEHSSLFSLGGGTALCGFYYPFRYSFDVDLFTQDRSLGDEVKGWDIDQINKFVEDLKKKLKKEGFQMTLGVFNEVRREFGLQLAEEAIRMDLVFDTSKKLGKSEESDIGVKIYSYKDITAEKVVTFAERCSQRDVIDVFFLLKKHKTPELATFAARKNEYFDLHSFSVRLRWVCDERKRFPDKIEDWDVKLRETVSIKELRNRFLEASREVQDIILKGYWRREQDYKL